MSLKNIDTKKQFAFFYLLKESSDSNFRTIIIYALLTGVSNAGVLAIINTAAQNTVHGEINFVFFSAFVICLVLYFFTRRYILVTTSKLVETTISSIRIRITDRIRETSLQLLDKLGTSSIYARLTQDTTTLSQSAQLLIVAMQSVIMIAFTLIYIAYVSIPAFFAVLGALGLSVALFVHINKRVAANMDEASVVEAKFFALLDGLLKGIKELKFNRRKNQEVFEDVESNVLEGKDLKVETDEQFAYSAVFSEAGFITTLGIIVFLLPVFSEAHAEEITKITTAVLFLIGPLTVTLSSLPTFSLASVAIKNIKDLEDQIKNAKPPAEHTNSKKYFDFKQIELRDVYFEYEDLDGDITFKSGPHNFTLKRGDKIFLTGGNGSGKSTFLKLLTSLYKPKYGEILVDGIPVKGNDVFPFRELFFSIFTDFHLFEQLYGIDVDSEEVNKRMFELGLTPEKVRFEEGKFTNLNLSTGQRKRLALVTCLMEDKPIFIMDEVAADQDPEFKQLFYADLIPKWIEKDGKTIILATHDDAYFQYGEEVHLTNGKITTKNSD